MVQLESGVISLKLEILFSPLQPSFINLRNRRLTELHVVEHARYMCLHVTALQSKGDGAVPGAEPLDQPLDQPLVSHW